MVPGLVWYLVWYLVWSGTWSGLVPGLRLSLLSEIEIKVWDWDWALRLRFGLRLIFWSEIGIRDWNWVMRLIFRSEFKIEIENVKLCIYWPCSGLFCVAFRQFLTVEVVERGWRRMRGDKVPWVRSLKFGGQRSSLVDSCVNWWHPCTATRQTPVSEKCKELRPNCS